MLTFKDNLLLLCSMHREDANCCDEGHYCSHATIKLAQKDIGLVDVRVRGIIKEVPALVSAAACNACPAVLAFLITEILNFSDAHRRHH